MDEQAGREHGSRPWVLAALAINAALALVAAALWLATGAPDGFVRADFTAFYAAWSIVRDGRGTALYDLALQGEYQARLMPGTQFEGGVLPYVNPPHLTLPFVPLAWLPRPVAFGLWTAAQLLLLGWTVRWFGWRLAAGWPARSRWLLVSALLAFPPLLSTLLLGAFSLPLLVALIGLYAALTAGRGPAAGAWLVLLTLKPQVAVLPVLLLLGARRWAALVSALLIGLGLAAAATLLLGAGIWSDYLQLARGHMLLFDRLGVDPARMWSLRGTLALWLGGERADLINAVSGGLLLVAAGITLWLWRGPWRPGTPAFDLRVALTLTLALLTAPHLNPHDGLLLALPVALGYRALRASGQPASAFAAAALAGPAAVLVAEAALGPRAGIRLPTLAMLLLALWLGLALRRAEAAARPAVAPGPLPMPVTPARSPGEGARRTRP
jgi:hypothetical protein